MSESDEGKDVLVAHAQLTQAQAKLLAAAGGLELKRAQLMANLVALTQDHANLRTALERRTAEHDAAVRRCDELASKNAELAALVYSLEEHRDKLVHRGDELEAELIRVAGQRDELAREIEAMKDAQPEKEV